MVSAPSVLALGLVLLAQDASLANATKTGCPGFGNDTLPTPNPTPCATIMVLPTPTPTPCATTMGSYSNSSSPSPTPASTSVDSSSNSTAPSPTPAATNANTYSNVTAPCPTPTTTTTAPSTPSPTAQDSSDSGAATVEPSDSSDTGLGSSFNASAPSPSARAQVTSSSSSSSCPPFTVTLFTDEDFNGQSGTVAAQVQTCYNSICIVPSQSPGSLEWFKPSMNSSDCYDAPKISVYANQDCNGDAKDTYASSDDFLSELSGVASFMVWETSDVPTTLTSQCAQR